MAFGNLPPAIKSAIFIVHESNPWSEVHTVHFHGKHNMRGFGDIGRIVNGHQF
jgi:hypothetical protein